YASLPIEYAHLSEALRLQLVRIMCLTLNGYDCTINKEALTECASSLDGTNAVLNFFKGSPKGNEKLSAAIAQLKLCSVELRKDPNSDKFDRLNFTKNFLGKAYALMAEFFIEKK